jgi:hypothetical protein
VTDLNQNGTTRDRHPELVAGGPVAGGPVQWRRRMAQELVHITVGYPRTPMMDVLEASSLWNGCRFVALPRHWGSAGFSLVTKVEILKSYLETGDVDMDSVILFTDAYDVLLAEHGSVMLEKFYATGTHIVFSAEPNFWPTAPDGREASRARFDEYDSTWRYLNSGCWIGYAWAAKLMLDDVHNSLINKNFEPAWGLNDQPLIQEYFLNNRHSKTCRLGFDTGPDLFCCLISHTDEFVIDRSRVRAKRTGRPISVLHANGNKENINILGRYWKLCGGAEGVARLHDLRVAVMDDKVMAYNAETRKLVPSHPLDPNLVVFLVKGDRHAIALSPAHGLMTFNGAGGLGTGATKIDIWEKLSVREVVTSYHETTLDTYCADSEGKPVTLAPLPLPALMTSSFDDLVTWVAQYEKRL